MQMFQPIQNPFFEQMKGTLKNLFKEKIINAGLDWTEEYDERLYEPLFNSLTNEGILEFKRVEVLSSVNTEENIKQIELLVNNKLVNITIRSEPQIAYLQDYYDFLEDNHLNEEDYSMESFIQENEIDASEIVYGIRTSHYIQDVGQLFLSANSQRTTATQNLRDAEIVIAGLAEVAAELEALGYDLSAGNGSYQSVGTDHTEEDYDDEEEDEDEIEIDDFDDDEDDEDFEDEEEDE